MLISPHGATIRGDQARNFSPHQVGILLLGIGSVVSLGCSQGETFVPTVASGAQRNVSSASVVESKAARPSSQPTTNDSSQEKAIVAEAAVANVVEEASQSATSLTKRAAQASRALPDPATDIPRGQRSAQHQAEHQRMVDALVAVRDLELKVNPFMGDKDILELQAKLDAAPSQPLTAETWRTRFQLAVGLLRMGREQSSLIHFKECEKQIPLLKESLPDDWIEMAYFYLAVNHLRIGETLNCCQRNTPDSCVLPIQGEGVHEKQEPSRSAIALLTRLLDHPKTSSTMRLRACWLVNIAHMTVGEYPDGVDTQWRIAPELLQSEEPFPRFINIGPEIGVGRFNLSGGAISDDFDSDGDLDLVVSCMEVGVSMVFYRREADGSFKPEIKAAGLEGMLGGLNITHADYDNDGDLDLLVLRGGWFNAKRSQPRSLLQNNGDGYFTDVTYSAGLGDAAFCTQTAAWFDFDNDGDLDVFIGAEIGGGDPNPSQLYRNEGNGTFVDVAEKAGVTNMRFAKGTSAGDYNNDGWIDLYVSNKGEENRLYKNRGDGTFEDVAPAMNVTKPIQSFPCWFWDFDNDGNLDLFVGSYDARIEKTTAALLGMKSNSELHKLYRGDGGETFVDVAEDRNLRQPSLPMGSNFGDLDNDGWLDFLLGTGDPEYFNLMPNKMYHNREGLAFSDVTTAGGFGNLQKGHAVAFADLDHDGDEDIFAELGGAFPGDRYFNNLYENPGFDQRWVCLRLEGVKSNRFGVGSKIELTIDSDGVERKLYRHLNSGGSFGGNPYRQHIGLANAEKIKKLKVNWAGSLHVDEWTDLPIDGLLTLTEGAKDAKFETLPPIPFKRLDADPSLEAPLGPALNLP